MSALLSMTSSEQVCPHCQSTSLFREEDIFGKFISCLTCGWCKDDDDLPQIKAKPPRRRNPSSGGMKL